MPEKNTKIVSQYYGEKGYSYEKKLCKLAKKITDVVPHKLTGVKTTDHEYWGLREVLTEPMIDVLLKMKQRKDLYQILQSYQKVLHRTITNTWLKLKN